MEPAKKTRFTEEEYVVELPGLGVSLPLAEIYAKVELFPEEEEWSGGDMRRRCGAVTGPR